MMTARLGRLQWETVDGFEQSAGGRIYKVSN